VRIPEMDKQTSGKKLFLVTFSSTKKSLASSESGESHKKTRSTDSRALAKTNSENLAIEK